MPPKTTKQVVIENDAGKAKNKEIIKPSAKKKVIVEKKEIAVKDKDVIKKITKKYYHQILDPIYKEGTIQVNTNDVKYVETVVKLYTLFGVSSFRLLDKTYMKENMRAFVPEEGMKFGFSKKEDLSAKSQTYYDLVEIYLKILNDKNETSYQKPCERFGSVYTLNCCIIHNLCYKNKNITEDNCYHNIHHGNVLTNSSLLYLIDNYKLYSECIGKERMTELIISKYNPSSGHQRLTKSLIRKLSFLPDDIIINALDNILSKYGKQLQSEYEYDSEKVIRLNMKNSIFTEYIDTLIKYNQLHILYLPNRLNNAHFLIVCNKMIACSDLIQQMSLFYILFNGYTNNKASKCRVRTIHSEDYNKNEQEALNNKFYVELYNRMAANFTITSKYLPYCFNKFIDMAYIMIHNEIKPSYDFLLECCRNHNLVLFEKCVSYKFLPDINCLQATVSGQYSPTMYNHIVKNYGVYPDNSIVECIVKTYSTGYVHSNYNKCGYPRESYYHNSKVDLDELGIKYTDYVMELCNKYENYPFPNEKLYKLKGGHILEFNEAIHRRTVKTVCTLGIKNKINPTQKQFDIACSAVYFDNIHMFLERLSINVGTAGDVYHDTEYWKFLQEQPVLYTLNKNNITSLSQRDYNLKATCDYLYDCLHSE